MLSYQISDFLEKDYSRYIYYETDQSNNASCINSWVTAVRRLAYPEQGILEVQQECHCATSLDSAEKKLIKADVDEK